MLPAESFLVLWLQLHSHTAYFPPRTRQTFTGPKPSILPHNNKAYRIFYSHSLIPRSLFWSFTLLSRLRLAVGTLGHAVEGMLNNHIPPSSPILLATHFFLQCLPSSLAFDQYRRAFTEGPRGREPRLFPSASIEPLHLGNTHVHTWANTYHGVVSFITRLIAFVRPSKSEVSPRRRAQKV
ncbi:MAG: hypothetical protein J3Q66DRAFT_323047 [Benniella sp.]|nr:MAG: hypothetical protein J3Q66DRAFT_323047 [Benniella sp.]